MPFHSELSRIRWLTRRCNRPQSAESIHAWISRHLPDGSKPPIQRPLNYVRMITVTTSILGVITFFSVAHPYILPIIQNRNLWAALSLIVVLLFTSGHMFNHIRKVPYVTGDGKGGISYFAGGFSNQFGMETQIVAAMCKCLDHLHWIYLSLLTLLRRYSRVCNHCSGAQSPSNVRSKGPTNRRIHLERSNARHVQLSPQCLPDKERGLPVSFTAFLSPNKSNWLKADVWLSIASILYTSRCQENTCRMAIWTLEWRFKRVVREK